jgi:hypothetical protein
MPGHQGQKKFRKFVPESEHEKALFDGALRRREVRLVLSGRLKPEEAHGLKALFQELEGNIEK